MASPRGRGSSYDVTSRVRQLGQKRVTGPAQSQGERTIKSWTLAGVVHQGSSLENGPHRLRQVQGAIEAQILTLIEYLSQSLILRGTLSCFWKKGLLESYYANFKPGKMRKPIRKIANLVSHLLHSRDTWSKTKAKNHTSRNQLYLAENWGASGMSRQNQRSPAMARGRTSGFSRPPRLLSTKHRFTHILWKRKGFLNFLPNPHLLKQDHHPYWACFIQKWTQIISKEVIWNL